MLCTHRKFCIRSCRWRTFKVSIAPHIFIHRRIASPKSIYFVLIKAFQSGQKGGSYFCQRISLGILRWPPAGLAWQAVTGEKRHRTATYWLSVLDSQQVALRCLSWKVRLSRLVLALRAHSARKEPPRKHVLFVFPVRSPGQQSASTVRPLENWHHDGRLVKL